MVTPAQRPTAYTGIPDATPGNNWFRRRAPLPSDNKNYTVGDRWLNLAALTAYIMVGKTASTATWQQIGAGGGGISTVTPDVGAPITAVGGNINIMGDMPGSGVRVVQNAVDEIVIQNLREGAHYVVAADGSKEYTTVQAAITQAVADGAAMGNPKMILVYPGVYTENLIVPDGIVLVGQSAEGRAAGTVVAGLCTIQPGSFVVFRDMAFSDTGGGTAISSTGAGTVLVLQSSRVSSSVTALDLGALGGNSLFMSNCLVNGVTGLNITNAASVIISETDINTTAAITATGSGNISITDCSSISSSITGSITLNSAMACSLLNSQIFGSITANDATIFDAAWAYIQGQIVANGTAFVRAVHSRIESGGVSAFSLAAGTSGTSVLNMIDCVAASTFWAAGTGSFATSNTNSLIGSATVIDPGLATSTYAIG